MDEKPKLKPDPEHLRQVGLQIWLPLAVAVAIVLGLTVLAIVLAATGMDPFQQWTDLSIIWLICPLCLCNLVVMALLGGLAFATYKAHGGVLPLLRKAQEKTGVMKETAQKLADKAAQPAITVGGWGAGWQAVKDRIRRIFKRK